MSMLRCDDCERLVDTDFDAEAIIDTSPTTTSCLCELCRDYLDADAEVQP